jgi:hypothetical protein
MSGIRAAADQTVAAVLQAAGEGARIREDGGGIGAELGFERLAEGDRLAGDDVQKGRPLQPGKDRVVDALCQLCVVGQDERARGRAVTCTSSS